MTPGSSHDGGHYFAQEPTAGSRPSTVELVLPDLSASLVSDRGVFSARRVDPGTKTLLVEMASTDAPADWPAGDLVDLGCGYGPITIALARRHPKRHVWAVDTNRRALELTALNARSAGVEHRVSTATPDQVPEGLEVAAIVSNPPIRIGKSALHGVLEVWLDRLRSGGEAWFVVAKNLGGDSLARWLGERGYPAERVASRRGYRVLRVQDLGSGQARGIHPEP